MTANIVGRQCRPTMLARVSSGVSSAGLTLQGPMPTRNGSPSNSPRFPFPLPSLPLEVGPLKYSYGVWGSAVSSTSGFWGGTPAEIEFGAF